MRLPTPPSDLDQKSRAYLDALVRELENILARMESDINGGGA